MPAPAAWIALAKSFEAGGGEARGAGGGAGGRGGGGKARGGKGGGAKVGGEAKVTLETVSPFQHPLGGIGVRAPTTEGKRKTGGKPGGHLTGGQHRWTGGAKPKGTPAPAAPKKEGIEVKSMEGAILSEEFGSFEFESPESATSPVKKKQRKHLHQSTVKKVDKNKTARDALKELKERARLNQVADLKEKLGNPFDDQDFVLTKKMALWVYLTLSEELGENVYNLVGEIFDHTRRWVFETLQEFKDAGGFCDSRSGKTFRLPSPIQDQSFRMKLCQYVKDNACPDGKKNLTSEDLTVWVNSELNLTGDDQYKSRTVRYKRYF